MTDPRTVLARAAVATLVTACLAGIWLSTPLAAMVAAVAAAAIVARLALGAVGHARVARRLRVSSRPGVHADVALRWGRLAGAAVAGLLRPEIHCDVGLRRRLSDTSLSAVVLHERYHQLRRDPLRLLVLGALGPFVTLLPGGRRWLEERRAALEIAADRYALRHGISRPAVARAILAVRRGEPAAGTAGFTSAQELRLRALVDGPLHQPLDCSSWNGVRSVLVTAALATGVCGLALVHHQLTAAGAIGCALAGC